MTVALPERLPDVQHVYTANDRLVTVNQLS